MTSPDRPVLYFCLIAAGVALCMTANDFAKVYETSQNKVEEVQARNQISAQAFRRNESSNEQGNTLPDSIRMQTADIRKERDRLLRDRDELVEALEEVLEECRQREDVDDNKDGSGVHANIWMRLGMDIGAVLAKVRHD